MPLSKNKKSKQSTTTATLAAKARAQLDAIEAGLPLQAAFTPEEKKRATPFLRIPPEAINIAATLVARQPKVFGSIDATAMTDAAAYELAMTPVEQQAAQLAASIHESIIAAKAPAAAQALAVYAIAKPLAYLKQGATTLPQLAEMKSLVRTTKARKKPKGDAAATTAKATTTATSDTPTTEAAPAATVDEAAGAAAATTKP